MTRLDRLIYRVLAIAACVAVVALILITEGDRPSFGPVPTTILEGGAVTEFVEEAPDYVPVADPHGTGIAGFVRYEDLSIDGPVPVVDFWLNVVGHLVPNRGFVPLGE